MQRLLAKHVLFVGGIAWMLIGCKPDPNSVSAHLPSNATPSFHADVAPIILQECASCHRPGRSGPFSLTQYAEVQKRGKQILEVIQSGTMPPWLPKDGYGTFEDERRLEPRQIETIEKWVKSGMPQGDPGDEPERPTFVQGWHLGEPDLVVQMSEPYPLQADGKDVYRNFVLPTGLLERRFVSAVELRPRNLQVVHHAFIKVDSTRESRDLDAEDPEPGFEGMTIPASMPGGQFLSWQPGKLPSRPDPRYSWELKPNDDLVLQIHLRPTGKPELVDAEIGLYFTDVPPSGRLMKIHLTTLNLEIPANETHYRIHEMFTLPVDVEVLGILPHAHYLAREMKGYAVLPDGTQQGLIWIPRWDFNWQGDYRYARPIALPKGSILHMEYTYDNSDQNVFNPFHPPQQVTYGPNSVDEMAELWLQLNLASESDRKTLEVAYAAYKSQVFISYYQRRIEADPLDVETMAKLALVFSAQGRYQEAMTQLSAAIRVQPAFAQAYYQRGLIHRIHEQLPLALESFQLAVQHDASHHRAHGNLGILFMDQGSFVLASNHLARAIEIYPNDGLARENLAHVLFRMGNLEEAAKQFKRVYELDPGNTAAQTNWQRIQSQL